MYYIVKVETCPVCKGSGVIQHPGWERFFSQHKKMSLSEIKSWWSNEGYSDIPDEEIECYRCDGAGYIEIRLP